MLDDRVAHKEFAVTMLEKLNEVSEFLRKIIFADETIFHISERVNKQHTHMGIRTPSCYSGAH
jgi:hypothetical protein